METLSKQRQDSGQTFHLLIDGERVEGASSFDVINPASGAPVARCPKADPAILDLAVDAARRAFRTWSTKPVEERASLIHALADRLEKEAGTLAPLLTAEQGKPTGQAHREIVLSAATLRAFSEMRVKPRTLLDEGSHTVIEHRTPLGVVAAIAPWNFPIALLINKMGPALLTGNTMVIKPAPTTPLTTLRFGELCQEILPPGVINIICDENDLGPLLVSHPGIDKISFTGSTATGKKVMASAAGGVKRLTLELGGNDAAIVLDDVDPVEVARKVYFGAMVNAGQVCVAIKRVYVPESIYNPFCEELARLATSAIVDDGDKPGTEMGPVQNAAQFARIKALIEEARQKGKIIAGGIALARPGYFIPPTIVRDLPDDAALVQEEQFGPVLPVLAYRDIDEVLERVNATTFGLGGTVWSRHIGRAMEVAAKVDAGTVWVNQSLVLDPAIPFQGAKESGLGSELGESGLLEYTQAHIINAVALS